jgi:ribosome biogenesis GTPase / thiamine phosphate phosphatase
LAQRSRVSRPERPGRVLSVVGGTYEIELDNGETAAAKLRGRLKLEQRTGDRVVAGDRVTVRIHGDEYTIESVEPRRTELARRAPGRGGRRAKVLVANVEQVVVVFAAAQPEPRLRLLDRLLVLAEANALPAVIVINKIDLAAGAEVLARFAAYRSAGYDLVLASATHGTGIDELASHVCGYDSVLTGPSGAGKSSLLNALEPGLGLRIGAISEAVNKGRHTTVSARLVPLGCGGHVADTPGLREAGLWGIQPTELPALFVEFRDVADACRFGSSCSHVHEPACAVRAAVAAGDIDTARYESYLAMRADEPEPLW